MFLMSISIVAYVAITILLAIFFVSSYVYRKGNTTCDSFLGIGCSPRHPIVGGHFGLLEFVLLTMLGVLFGFSGFYYVAIAVIITQLIWMRYDTKTNNCTFASFVHEKSNLTLSIIVSVYQLFAYLALISFTMMTMAKIFQSLLGWNFVNSVIGISGFTIVYILIGGYKAVRINKLISYIIFFSISIIFLAFVGFNTHWFLDIFANLSKLSHLQNYPLNHYLVFNCETNWLGIIALLTVGLVGLQILYNKVSAVKRSQLHLLGLFIKLIAIFSVVLTGITTLGTNVGSKTINGHQIVTYQTGLANGELGYVVKMVNDNESNVKPVLGILPPLLNDKTNLIESNTYNYVLSGIVAMQHYLPNELKFLIILAIMSLFIASISQYLLHSSRVLVRDIVRPLGLFNQYEDTGKLWMARVMIPIMVFLGLVISYFLLSHYDLLNFFYLFLIIFIAPLFIVLTLLSFL